MHCSSQITKGIVSSSQTSKRLALVFGNTIYKNYIKLSNTRNDAEDIGEKLKSLGFVVSGVLLDRDHTDMLSDIEGFANGIDDDVSDIVIYYAGHGCSMSEFTIIVSV